MHRNVQLKQKYIEYNEYYLQERINLWFVSNFYEISPEIFLHNHLTHRYSGVKLFSRLEYIQLVLTSKTRRVLNSVKQSHIFMCHRSAGDNQKYIRQVCNLHLIYDVAGVNGCIFRVSDLQPGSAAPTSAIQGPSRTFTWRFLQTRHFGE